MAWDEVKDVFRPDFERDVHRGVMEVDEELCTNCGLCVQNCAFRCWTADDQGIPRLKDGYMCFSCFNCQVCCPVGAISIVESYHVHGGPFATAPHPLPVKMPREPRDEQGDPAQWNAVERAVFMRRSVRNYTDKPVPEPLIRRVLEAGRFAPTAINAQPWQFVVVTNKFLLEEMDEYIGRNLEQAYDAYTDDERVKCLAASWESTPARTPMAYDPRLCHGGYATFGKGLAQVLFGAPVVILVCADQRYSSAATSAAIAAQNMTLVAKSLDLGSCYTGFAVRLNESQDLLQRLGIRDPFRINTALALGYPRFRQEGLVPREFRPLVWVRQGGSGPEIEE